MDVETLRSRGDRELFELLKQDRTVQRASEQLAAQEEKTPLGIRRRLLATALRLTPTMAPQVFRIMEACRERLEVVIPVETYVYSSPDFNAACVKPESGRLFILLSSSLLEAFRDDELKFVVGHELGHHLLAHHDVPIGQLLRGKERPSPELALKVFSWSRYAEFSADRCGAYCAENPDAVATALFRLASGLRTDMIKLQIDAFADQVDAMQEESIAPDMRPPVQDWFTTHPFSPLRVKALRHFAASTLMGGELSVDELEAHVATLMALMEPSYLDAQTEVAEIMRRLLFAGAIAVADADGTISEAEIAVFEKFFGAGSYTDRLDLEAIQGDLDARIELAKATIPFAKRVQVVRDLCVVVRAEGLVSPKGHTVLCEISERLEVPAAVVDQTLQAALEPD